MTWLHHTTQSLNNRTLILNDFVFVLHCIGLYGTNKTNGGNKSHLPIMKSVSFKQIICWNMYTSIHTMGLFRLATHFPINDYVFVLNFHIISDTKHEFVHSLVAPKIVTNLYRNSQLTDAYVCGRSIQIHKSVIECKWSVTRGASGHHQHHLQFVLLSIGLNISN